MAVSVRQLTSLLRVVRILQQAQECTPKLASVYYYNHCIPTPAKSNELLHLDNCLPPFPRSNYIYIMHVQIVLFYWEANPTLLECATLSLTCLWFLSYPSAIMDHRCLTTTLLRVPMVATILPLAHTHSIITTVPTLPSTCLREVDAILTMLPDSLTTVNPAQEGEEEDITIATRWHRAVIILLTNKVQTFGCS